jgi:ketosteroid isomerase-like protein
MYRLMVRRMVRRAYRHLRQGDYEPVVEQFSPSSRFVMAGAHALGGERRGAEEVRRWFQRVFELFPGLQIVPYEVLVNGWPWNTVISTHFTVHATLGDGRPYRNEGMQLLRLRWGKVVEDLLFEDTQKLDAELQRMGQHGLSEAPSHAA